MGNAQYPGPVCSLNHRSPPGAVTTGYPELGGTIPDVLLWLQWGTWIGKRTMRGPITQPPMSTTGLFLRRRRRLRFVFSVVCSCSKELELVGDDGEGVQVREWLCDLASSSESASSSLGLGSDSPCVVSGHRSWSKPPSTQGKNATCPSRGVCGRDGVEGTVVG